MTPTTNLINFNPVLKHGVALLATILYFLLPFGTGGYLSAQFSGGSGTQADPYRISSKDDMENVINGVGYVNNNNTYFDLTQDITG